MKRDFESTGKLLSFFLRRERVMSLLWVILLSAFSVVLAPGLAGMFDSTAREALLITLDNPAMIAIQGPIYGIEHYTTGAMYFNMMVQWMMITSAIMNILLVVRHTRADEEYGRADLLRSLSTGRFAPLCAVMLTALAVNLAVLLLTGVGIGLFRVEDMGWNGAMLYAAAVAVVGLLFAAVAAVAAQLCKTARGAIGLSVLALGGFYLLRGIGDIRSETLSVLSPLGLAQRTQAFVKNNWLPIGVLLAETLVLAALAAALNAHRDIRQGYFPERKGRVRASALLRSPAGLAFRLLEMPFWGWLLGMFIIGVSYGSILGTIDSFVQSSEFYAMMIGANPEYSTAQMFTSMVNCIMALLAVFPVLTMALHIRTEEKDGYFLNLLSGAVSRFRYLAGYVLLAFVTSLLTQCATALGLYSAAVAVLPDADMLPLGFLFKANLVYAPALWVMLGLAVLLIGLWPKAVPVIWVYYAFSFCVVFLGRIPELFPEWLIKLTPFGWVPNLPAEELHGGTLAAMTLLAAVLTGIGFAAYRRRDISSAK